MTTPPSFAPPVPPGWTPAAWHQYVADPDGGRAPMRAERLPYPPDTTPSVAEVLSWEVE